MQSSSQNWSDFEQNKNPKIRMENNFTVTTNLRVVNMTNQKLIGRIIDSSKRMIIRIQKV